MPLSTDVNLPKEHKARFPNRCVVCGCSDPNSNVRLITGAIGWWTWLLWMFGNPFTVKAPACSSCGWRLHLKRLVNLLITVGLIAVAFVYLWPLVSDQLPRTARNWIMMGLGLLCLTPQIIYEVFFPHPFDITAYSNSVDYEFRDEDMAYEFAELNDHAAWVKIK